MDQKSNLPAVRSRNNSDHSHTRSDSSRRVQPNTFFNIGMLAGVVYLGSQPGMRSAENALFTLVAIPVLTLMLATPRRINVLGYLRLLKAEFLSLGLRVYAKITQHPIDKALFNAYINDEVINIYGDAGALSGALGRDPAGLLHARRLGKLSAFFVTVAALSLPVIYPGHFTYGHGLSAVGVFAFDLLTFGLTSFIVCERIAIHLYEVNSNIRLSSHAGRFFVGLPMMVILGAATGAIGSLVILNMGALASGLESMAFCSFTQATFAFSRTLVCLSLPLGVALGAMMGAGIAMAYPSDND